MKLLVLLQRQIRAFEPKSHNNFATWCIFELSRLIRNREE